MKKKKEWEFKETLPEEDLPKRMWDAVELARSGKLEEAVNLLKDDIDLTPKLFSKYITSKDLSPLVDVSRSTLCFYALLIYHKAGCISCISSLLKDVSHTPECQVAVKRFMESVEGSLETLKKVLDQSPMELLYVLHDLPKEDVEKLYEDIFKIAKNEIGEKQYLALMVVEQFINREEVFDLFKGFAEDWDPKVRRIAIGALSRSGRDVRQLFEKLLKEEDDAVNISIIRRYLDEGGA